MTERCPDGGACHHECSYLECFRVRSCGPLSGVFPQDQWPLEVSLEHGADLPEVKALDTYIQRAIEEWATLAGGPNGTEAEPSLARYIADRLTRNGG
jgi:hypothetical protein